MSEYKNLKLSTEDRILTLSINRPDSLNALNSETLTELKSAMESALEDDQIGAIIITGVGEKAFVAGADIKEIAELNEVSGRKFSENGQEIFELVEHSEKPVIAAVNGFALGGGCELAMACHIRIASDNAQFGQPEVKLGVIPGYGGTQRLPQLIGKGRALELMMTGKSISAEEAYRIGLVNQVTSIEDLLTECKSLLTKILGMAPIAIANVVRSVNAAFENEENGYQVEANSFLNCCRTEDFKEGTTAFIEKRSPNFSGQ